MADLWAGRDAAEESEVDELWDGEASQRLRRGDDAPAGRGVFGYIQLTARVLLAVVLLGGPIVVGWVGLDLLSVRGSLQEARSAIAELRGSLGDVDPDAALASLEVAEEEIADAERRAGRVTWTIAGTLPFLGPSVQVTQDVVEVAAAAIEVGGIGLREGEQLLAEGFEVVVVDGTLDLEPVLQARELVAQLPLERLNVARDALATPTDRWLPDEVRQGRADTLELADETVELLDRADALTAALPGLLGADGPRRYFIGMQTSAELRGTGGLIGFWGILTVDDGRIVFGQSAAYDPFDDVGAPQGETGVERIGGLGLLASEDPPNVDPEFRARYATTAAARSFPNVNLDPDLPTTGKAILNLIELRTGQRLDGVILLDPVGLQRMLEATGDTLPLSGDLTAELALEDGLPVQDLARFITADIYEVFGFDRSSERKDALREIGDRAFEQVVRGGWDSAAMVGAVADATTQRHLQVYVTDDEVQSALHRVRATGSLEVPDATDRFAVIANNVVGGKQDVHLGHTFRFAIDLERIRLTGDGAVVADRRAMLDVEVDNPLPTEGMDLYVIGNCYRPGQANRCFEGDPGYNRTWFSIWTAPSTRVAGFSSDDGTRPGLFSKTFRGLRVVDHFLLTPPSGQAGFRMDVTGPVPIQRGLEDVVYEFEWWRQSKATPDRLEVAVAAPDGWEISDVEVVGGGDGTGLGVFGEGQELEVEVGNGIVELAGTVTADTRLRIHLVQAFDDAREAAASP